MEHSTAGAADCPRCRREDINTARNIGNSKYNQFNSKFDSNSNSNCKCTNIGAEREAPGGVMITIIIIIMFIIFIIIIVSIALIVMHMFVPGLGERQHARGKIGAYKYKTIL